MHVRGDTTFVLLSFARPGNMQRIVDAALESSSCRRVVLSNNNPTIDILEHVDPSRPGLTVLQQKEPWEPVNRYLIAHHCGTTTDDRYISIDDDLFLTPAQIDELADRLRADPAVPHGVWGETIGITHDRSGTPLLRVESGLHGRDAPVDVINRAYAFTGRHVRRYFELLPAMGISDPRNLGRGDDIVLSYCGDGLPRCHDLGTLESCPTSDTPGIALWRSPGFFEERHAKLLKLSRLIPGRALRRI